jgi:hypothetical protein
MIRADAPLCNMFSNSCLPVPMHMHAPVRSFVRSCVRACVRCREREREGETGRQRACERAHVHVCVCWFGNSHGIPRRKVSVHKVERPLWLPNRRTLRRADDTPKRQRRDLVHVGAEGLDIRRGREYGQAVSLPLPPVHLERHASNGVAHLVQHLWHSILALCWKLHLDQAVGVYASLLVPIIKASVCASPKARG